MGAIDGYGRRGLASKALCQTHTHKERERERDARREREREREMHARARAHTHTHTHTHTRTQPDIQTHTHAHIYPRTNQLGLGHPGCRQEVNSEAIIFVFKRDLSSVQKRPTVCQKSAIGIAFTAR